MSFLGELSLETNYNTNVLTVVVKHKTVFSPFNLTEHFYLNGIFNKNVGQDLKVSSCTKSEVIFLPFSQFPLTYFLMHLGSLGSVKHLIQPVRLVWSGATDSSYFSCLRLDVT